MSKLNPKPALKVLREHSTVLIFGHEDPDADCLGSQRALGSWLSRQGKTVRLCSAGPWSRPEIADWQMYFEARIPPIDALEDGLMVLLDCSSPDRTGFPVSDLPSLPVLVVDHHSTGGDFGDVRCIDSSYPSTTLLIQKIIEAAGDKPTRDEADLLFLGFCTDTGFFRHLEPGNPEPLNAAARLVAAGASPADTHRLLAGGRTVGSRKLLGRALDRTELHLQGRVAVTWEDWKDWRDLGRDKDSGMLYQLLTGITGVNAAVLIREQTDGMCSVGMRSITALDVADIAGYFGGGGHKKAAGCTISGDRYDVLEHLLRIFADRLG